MSTKEINIAILSAIPDDEQEDIFEYLKSNYCSGTPYEPLSKEEILTQLAESRANYNNGEFEDFDIALNDISNKYGL